MRVEAALIKNSVSSEVMPETYGSRFAAEWETWRKLWNRKLRDRTWIGVLIMFFQRKFHLCRSSLLSQSFSEWSGINALLYYGPTLVQSIGLRGDTVTLLVSGGIGVTQLIAVLPAIMWIDKVGRRPLLRGSSRMCSSSKYLHN